MKTYRIAPKTRTCLIVLGGFLVLALLLVLGKGAGAGAAAADKLTTREERTAYLAACGWTADPQSEQTQIIHIPEVFSPVYEDYNELQRQQGFDLADYAGRDCTLYTYAVTNYPDETQTVLANLYLYRDRVIGGDVHSTNLNGFMIGLR